MNNSLKYIYLIIFFFSVQLNFAQSLENHRVIILTDIEADPDDTQSLVRLLLYSNEIDIKGIVATTSCWQKSEIHPESIIRIVKAYKKVLPNLLLHYSNYPDAEKLFSLIKKGLPLYGMSGVGNDKDSEGSDLIINELQKKDERPLWVSIWGGSNTLAQALLKIKNSKTEKEQKELISKLRVYTISDQDDSGIWIRNNFPELFYIVSPGDDYGSSTWSGINSFIDGIDNRKISNSWLAENIQQNHSSLGAVYPDVSWGMEGDTPSFLLLIQNGLNSPEHPDWGSWGGRYELKLPDLSSGKKGTSGVPSEVETRKIWTDAEDNFTPFILNEYGRSIKQDSNNFIGNKVSLWRWRDDFQNDFAARMDWCTKPFGNANHAPIIIKNFPEEITVKSSQLFILDAIDSYDPDGDGISFFWFNYPEAGTYKKSIMIDGAENSHIVKLFAPKVESDETAHIILKVTDKGSPNLCAYKRVVVKIIP